MEWEIWFVDDSLKDSNCPVCLGVLKDPFLTECCGHHFCKRCIDSVVHEKNECPLCKTFPVRGIVDKRFKRELNEAQIYCPLQQQGCEWIGKLGNLNTHLNEGELSGQCRYVTVNCPNNCHGTFLRRDVKRHANNECEYRPFTCPYCGHKGVFVVVELHHYPTCPDYPVICPNKCSKKTIKRSQLKKHFDVCPNTTVSCPFSKVGCKAKMKRCNLKKHNDSNFTQHQTLISAAIADLQGETTTMKKDHQLYSQQISTHLEQIQTKISSLENRCSNLEDEFYEITEEVEQQKKQFTQERDHSQNCLQLLFANCSELQETLNVTCEENEELKYRLESLQSNYDELKSHLAASDDLSAVKHAEMKETLSAFMAETKKMLKDEVASKMAPMQQDLSTLSQKHSHVDHWINGYKLMAEKMKEMNWELYLRTMAETATQFPDPICPVIIQVNGYGEAKQQKHTLVTSSFYINTTKGDYKFVLVVNFTMDKMVVSASLTKGKNDKHLPWPFTGTIYVTLLNLLENKNHYGKEIWSSTDNPGFKYAGKPTDQWRNPSWSKQDFISLNELEQQCFIMNNSLYFEVDNSAKRENDANKCCLS